MYFQFDLPFCNKILQSVEIQNAKDIMDYSSDTQWDKDII